MYEYVRTYDTYLITFLFLMVEKKKKYFNEKSFFVFTDIIV